MFKYGLKIKNILELIIYLSKKERKKERKMITVVCYVCDVVNIVFFLNAVRRPCIAIQHTA